MTKAVLGIIGGSGIYDLPGLRKARRKTIKSPWGEPSAPLRIGEIGGTSVVFLARHDEGHRLSPSDINYRANIDVLKRAGVTDLVSLSACGSFKQELPPGSYYNKIFSAHIIRMPPPLTDQRVDYTDGTPTTVEQYAKDISAFLMWAAEPHLMQRKRVGLQVVIFLIVLAGLLYFTKKKVWHAVELHPEALKPRPPVEYPPP